MRYDDPGELFLPVEVASKRVACAHTQSAAERTDFILRLHRIAQVHAFRYFLLHKLDRRASKFLPEATRQHQGPHQFALTTCQPAGHAAVRRTHLVPQSCW